MNVLIENVRPSILDLILKTGSIEWKQCFWAKTAWTLDGHLKINLLNINTLRVSKMDGIASIFLDKRCPKWTFVKYCLSNSYKKFVHRASMFKCVKKHEYGL
ncbi:MAG: hypothetical protein AAF363_14395 [Bacteroidota bacterium]